MLRTDDPEVSKQHTSAPGTVLLRAVRGEQPTVSTQSTRCRMKTRNSCGGGLARHQCDQDCDGDTGMTERWHLSYNPVIVATVLKSACSGTREHSPCSFPLHVVIPFSMMPSPSELGLSEDSFWKDTKGYVIPPMATWPVMFDSSVKFSAKGRKCGLNSTYRLVRPPGLL